MAIKITPKTISGHVSLPPSKSLAHRAIICASLAKGKSTIRHIEYSQDIEATISAMKALGTMIFKHDDYLEIDGTTTFMKNTCDINCFESGSTLRFMVPISLVCESSVHFTGEDRLGQRPLDIYYRIFEQQNISYLYREDSLDLYIRGQLRAGQFEIPGDVSSQFLSGLLFALPLMDEDSKIVVTSPLESRSYLDLTLQTLRLYGIHVENHQYQELVIPGRQVYQSCDYEVEGDFSQAANYLVAGALGNSVVLEGLNLESLQGDRAAISILERMGCHLRLVDEGYQMISETMTPTIIDGSQCPDIIPVIALACALTPGETVIKNVSRLRIKECDRLAATAEVINCLGGWALEKQDNLVIRGVETLKGACLSTYNDHRMAMMIAIASTVCQGDITIDNESCVQKSYPCFWEHFKMLGGIYHECNMGD